MTLPDIGQTRLDEEIIVDSFAGGGGTSTGIELATGRVVDAAINHDPDAILMHKTNHPYTMHYQASVWDVDPREVCRGRKVGLFWASPDCKHFSKAKGGKPVDRRIRGLAWIVLRWAGTVRPRVIILENVEEFQTWGPVRRGRPVKSRSGETFRRFIGQLDALGYAVEWRELVAADYGAPTTRKRFFLIARCDGRPIAWPEPTHAPADSSAVKSGQKKPWKSAAEIIDWSLPCPSVFDTREQIREKYGLSAQRPLRPNTMRRVIRGVDKFAIKNPEPFLVVVNHAGDFRGQDAAAPLQTVTAKHGYSVASPVMAPLTMHNNENATGTGITEPVNTITSSGAGGHQMVITPTLAAIGQTGGGERGRKITEPTHTQVSKAEPGAELGHWPEIRDLLNTYCGYNLGPEDVILFEIDSAAYFLADIGLRMLTPRELYRANGFPDDYKIDRDYKGNVYGKSKQVARCGNAVPPPFATALVRANLPEWCGEEIRTMAELERKVAV